MGGEHKEGYWTHFQKQCTKEGRCYKCSCKLFKWGLCRRHYKANRESSARRRPAKPQQANGKRAYNCGRCGGEGHNKATCSQRS